MEKYDVLVIGFGKAGKTLAAKLAKQGKKVAMVEKDSGMYGGTCINVGCIPTKTLIHNALYGKNFNEAMAEKEAVTARLRAKNFAMLDNMAEVDVYTAAAKFISNKVVEITAGDEKKELTAEIIIINTGSVSNVLPIPGLTSTKMFMTVQVSKGFQSCRQDLVS